MKAQVSLEFLVVIVIITASFSMVVPSVLSLKHAAEKRLVLENAENLLSEIYYSCERAAITGDTQSFYFNALSGYSLSSESSIVYLESAEVSLEKKLRFKCDLSMNLSKGRNNVSLEAS